MQQGNRYHVTTLHKIYKHHNTMKTEHTTKALVRVPFLRIPRSNEAADDRELDIKYYKAFISRKTSKHNERLGSAPISEGIEVQ